MEKKYHVILTDELGEKELEEIQDTEMSLLHIEVESIQCN